MYWIGRTSSGVTTNFLCLISEQNQVLVCPIWNKLLLGSATDFIGPDSVELLIAVAPG